MLSVGEGAGGSGDGQFQQASALYLQDEVRIRYVDSLSHNCITRQDRAGLSG